MFCFYATKIWGEPSYDDRNDRVIGTVHYLVGKHNCWMEIWTNYEVLQLNLIMYKKNVNLNKLQRSFTIEPYHVLKKQLLSL